VDPDDLIAAIRDGTRWAAPAMVTLVSPVLLGYAAAIAPDLTPAEEPNKLRDFPRTIAEGRRHLPHRPPRPLTAVPLNIGRW